MRKVPQIPRRPMPRKTSPKLRTAVVVAAMVLVVVAAMATTTQLRMADGVEDNPHPGLRRESQESKLRIP